MSTRQRRRGGRGVKRIEDTLSELQERIRAQFPAATFEVARGADDPREIHLLTTVDIEDPEEVLNLVIDRLLELQIDEDLPVHVIPLRLLGRELEALRAGRQAEAADRGTSQPAPAERTPRGPVTSTNVPGTLSPPTALYWHASCPWHRASALMNP